MEERRVSYITIGIINVLIYLVAIVLHSIGIYLLRHSVHRMQTNQRLFLTNFSIAEIAMCFVQIGYVFGHMVDYRPLQVYAGLCQCTLAISWSLLMILLTLDRFLEIKLNIKYELYVSNSRVLWANIALWVLAAVNALWMICFQSLTDVEVLSIVFKFIFPVFEAGFLVTCTFVYVYIFMKIKAKKKDAKRKLQQRVNVPELGEYEKQMRERRRKETRARNFVPFYIIVTFVIFSMVPELISVIFLYILKWEDQRTYVMLGSTALFAAGYVVDALIYILMYRQLKHLLFKKVFKNRIVTTSMAERTLHQTGMTKTIHMDFKSAY